MYLIYDTETTGLPLPGAPAGHPDQPYIMQLGAALVGEDFEIVEELDTLIKLPEGVEPHPKALEAHGISAADCRENGREPVEVYRLFGALAARAHTFVCHNVQFDSKLWAIFCARHDCNNPVYPHICTMELMTPIMKMRGRSFRGTYKWPKCQEAYGFVTGGQQFENAHDAMADVRATAVILRWLASTGQLPRRPSEALVGGQSTWLGAPIVTTPPEGKLTTTYTSEVPRVPAPEPWRLGDLSPETQAALMDGQKEQPSAKRGAAAVGNGCVEEADLRANPISQLREAGVRAGCDGGTEDMPPVATLPVNNTTDRKTFHIPIAHIQTR